MRLCLVGDVQSIHIQRFASYLAYSNEVHLLTHTAGSCNDTVVHDIGPYLPPTRIDYNTIRQLLRTVGRVKKAIKEVRPDIVHGHYLQDAAFFAARSGYHPLVVSAWGSDVLIHPFRSRAYRLMTKYVLKRADRIHSVSRHLTEKLIELGAKKEKILTVPMGVNIEKFKPDRELRERENLIVSTRSLKPVYNVDLLIRSVPLVAEQIEDVRIVIAGDGELRESLKNIAEALQVTGRVEFIGSIMHEEVPKLLNSGRVYVSMSSSDGTSASLLEAMACGLFPVVSDIPANRAWIEDGKNGFLVPLDNQEILARRIVEALQDGDLADAAMKRNIELIKRRALWRDNMKLIETVYRQLCEGG